MFITKVISEELLIIIPATINLLAIKYLYLLVNSLSLSANGASVERFVSNAQFISKGSYLLELNPNISKYTPSIRKIIDIAILLPPYSEKSICNSIHKKLNKG